MVIVPPILTCSTCDDYRFIDGADGKLAPCPDCRPAVLVKCLAHGEPLQRDGKCRSCLYEAQVVEERITLGIGRMADPIAEAIFS